MAVKATKHFEGADFEVGTFTLDPANIAGADAVGADTVTIAGAKVGHLIFVNTEDPTAAAVASGAKVTAANTVTVYTQNTKGTATDPASKTYSYILVKVAGV